MRYSVGKAGIIVTLLVASCCITPVALAAPPDTQAPALIQTDDAVPQVSDSIIPQADDQPAPDNTITRIDLAANGSATWEITLRTRLSDDSDVTEYERFQDRFQSNTSRYLDPFTDRMTGVVRAANNSSPRAMRATNFAAETTIQEVPRRWGIVQYRFTWTGFAPTEEGAVVVGDIFAGGFFIGEDDVLLIAAPNGYVIESASPAPDETAAGRVEWRGRVDFDDERPSVRAVPAASSGHDDAGDQNGVDVDESDRNLNVFDIMVFASIVSLVVLVGVVYAIRTGLVSRWRSGKYDTRGNDGEGTIDDTFENDGTPTRNTAVSPAGSTVQPELLTDEDQVKNLLDEHGGRMKQSTIVDELGWSKSKTSRVLSKMDDEATISKLRIGRENVIELEADSADQKTGTEYTGDEENSD